MKWRLLEGQLLSKTNKMAGYEGILGRHSQFPTCAVRKIYLQKRLKMTPKYGFKFRLLVDTLFDYAIDCRLTYRGLSYTIPDYHWSDINLRHFPGLRTFHSCSFCLILLYYHNFMYEMHLEIPIFDVAPIVIRYRVTGVSVLCSKPCIFLVGCGLTLLCVTQTLNYVTVNGQTKLFKYMHCKRS